MARRAGRTRHHRTHTRAHRQTRIQDSHRASGNRVPHARQAIQITRRPKRIGAKKWDTCEVVYAVTDLPADQASAKELATWIRQHWHIENELRWVRDVTYDEDRSQIRTDTGPCGMASLRNLAVTACRITGHDNIAQALRYHGWDQRRPLKLLLTL